jgi:anti-sigma regulatory factor (Ser/Thr protein kinase)
MAKKRVLTIPGRFSEIKGLCEFVAEGAAEAGLDEDAIFQIELCCDEAATNIIEHAYGAEDVGTIVCICEVDDGAVTVTLHDNGRPFNPEAVKSPPVFDQSAAQTPGEVSDRLQVGGLGLHFIRNLMDEVHFTFDQERGNTLVMVKKRNQEKSG